MSGVSLPGFPWGPVTKTTRLRNTGTKPVTLNRLSYRNSTSGNTVTYTTTCSSGTVLQPNQACSVNWAVNITHRNEDYREYSSYAEFSMAIEDAPALVPVLVRAQAVGGVKMWVAMNVTGPADLGLSKHVWSGTAPPYYVTATIANAGGAIPWNTFTPATTIGLRVNGVDRADITYIPSSTPGECQPGVPFLGSCPLTVPVNVSDYRSNFYTFKTTSGAEVGVQFINYATRYPASDISLLGPAAINIAATPVGGTAVSPSAASGNATILQTPNVYQGSWGSKYGISGWRITGANASDFTLVPPTYPGCAGTGTGTRPTRLTVADPWTTPRGHAQCDIQVLFTPSGPGPRTATLSADFNYYTHLLAERPRCKSRCPGWVHHRLTWPVGWVAIPAPRAQAFVFCRTRED